MLSKKMIFGSIASFGLLVAVPNNNVLAQIPHETHPSATEKTSEFQYVQQPLWVKGAVTASILGLIGLEVWWFLLSKPKAKTAQFSDGIQEVTIIVDGGYEPSRVIVNAGQLVRLNFLRHDKSSCLEQVVFPDFHIAQELNLNQVTPIEFTPKKPGQYTFACGMNMFRGVVEVR